jgi:16S rRNA processing protein RimM
VRGEVRVEVMTDFPERRFAPGSRLLVGHEVPDLRSEAASATEPLEVVVRSARPHGSALLVFFDDFADRTAVGALVGMALFVRIDEALELEPGAYYEHELVGCVVSTVDGRELGSIVELMETGAADVLVIRDGQTHRQWLVPLAEGIVSAVDVAARRVVIDPIPGLLD